MNPAFKRHYQNIDHGTMEEQLKEIVAFENSITHLRRFRKWN